MRAVNSIPLFLLSFFIWAGPAKGQEAPRAERIGRAHESIKALKGGALIVRLPSHQRKIDALKDVLSNTRRNDPNRKRLEKQLEETLADKQEFNENMMAAFRKNFSFAKTYFMLDTATALLKNGQFRGIFLDDKLQPDPAIVPSGPPPYFVLRFGSTSDMATDGLQAMAIMDDQLRDLEKPFPYYQRLHDFSAIMGGIFPAPGQKQKDALRIVGKLNKKLQAYYEGVMLAEEQAN